jgi:primosomal protein N' (replication factor Y) (superfamily II helicase)
VGPLRQGRVPRAKLRAVIRVLDAAPMRAELRDFLTRVGDYTLTPLPAMLRLATRAPGLGQGPATRKLLYRGDADAKTDDQAREKVLAACARVGGAGLTTGELAHAAGVSAGVVRGLVQAGALVEREAPRDQPYPRLDPRAQGTVLTPDQAQAAGAVRAGVAGRALWHNAAERGDRVGQDRGVSGSRRRLPWPKGGRRWCCLPEIALTAEFLTRVEARFGARPAEWHSGVTLSERRRCWRMVARGEAQFVVGARSALFLPFRDLGLIVVDEEHDTSYKQEEGVLYNARDMAVLRGP